MPVAGGEVTSEYGQRTHPTTGKAHTMHHGVDIAALEGTPVIAVDGGTIEQRNNPGGYGQYVLQRTPGGQRLIMGHLSRYHGVSGQQVSPGDTVGYVGSTGRSNGPHLHFEVRIGVGWGTSIRHDSMYPRLNLYPRR